MDEFRNLGGIAENVVLLPSLSGQGLFPKDPAKPLLVHVPDNLLFRLRDIGFEGDRIRIGEHAETGSRERSFFERYQSSFSWGDAGHAQSAELIDLFDSLAPDLRALLVAEFGMSLFMEGDRRERIRKHFLRSRSVRWDDESLLVPLLDLMGGGSNGMRVDTGPQGGVQIAGEAQGELHLSYGFHDCLGVFNKYGFATARPHAFSLPMKIKVGAFNLTITRNIMHNTNRAGFVLPVMTSEAGEVFVSHLMVGNANSPRASRGIFYGLMREAGAAGAMDAFDQVLHFNRAKFLQLLEALELLRGEMVVRLRAMAHLHLEALAQCVGTREF